MTDSFDKKTANTLPVPIGCLLYPLLVFILLATAGYFYIQNANYHSAIEATKEWARLNEFPQTARNFTVETGGNLFSREFVVEFEAATADVEKWLSESPGTSSVVPVVSGPVRRYKIEPGGGAQRAELEFNETTGRVKIHAVWS